MKRKTIIQTSINKSFPKNQNQIILTIVVIVNNIA